MSTTPTLEPEQQQPPPLPMIQQAYTAHSGHGSVGPVIGVLAVIVILGALAVMVGRLCSGRRIMGHGQYDFESWVETKCATCLDGLVDQPRPRMVVAPPPEAVPAAAQQETGEVRKDEEIAQPNNPHERAES